MGKPSKYEKETIINFNEGEKEASIYTFNADLKRRLAGLAFCGSTEGGSLLCRVQGRSSPVGVKGQRPLAG